MLPSSSVHCNSSKCSHVLLHREHWSRNVDATSNFDHPFYKIFCICAHPFLFLSCHMEKDLFLTKVKPATPDMDFFPTFLLGTSPCHLTASHQNLRPPSFYYLTLFFNMAHFPPIVKTSRHTYNKTKQSFLCIQCTRSTSMRIQSYLCLLYFPQNFRNVLSPFTSTIYSLYSKGACARVKNKLLSLNPKSTF